MISSYTSGRVSPKIDVLINICYHFNITIDDVIKNDLSITGINKPKEVKKEDEVDIIKLLTQSIKDEDRLIELLEKELSTTNLAVKRKLA